MAWLAAIGTLLQILFLLLQKWFQWTDEQKQKANDILKDAPNAKDPSSITAIFDRINRI
jgi:hypothetical protein